jgi:uncharacterized protein with beta-barrel porin domain
VVDAPNTGIGAIVNAGTILSNQTTSGYGFSVDPSASVASIANNNGGLIQASGSGGIAAYINYGYVGNLTNNAGGVIQATGPNGVAIEFDGNYPAQQTSQGTIANSGTIQATGNGSIAIYSNSGYIASIANNAGGVVQATGRSGSAVLNYGYIGSVANNVGLIQATGSYGTAINNYSYRGSGTIAIGSVANNVGLIQATGTNGIAINNYAYRGSGSVTIGSITNNGGTIQSDVGSSISRSRYLGIGGNAINNYAERGSGTTAIGSITNTAGGLIQANGTRGVAINNYAYEGSGTNTIGSITNTANSIIQATGSGGAAISNYNYDYKGSATVTIGLIANSGGLIQATGLNGYAISNQSYGYAGSLDATISSIANSAGGMIQATGSAGSAIYNYSYIGSIANSAGATIQATGANGKGIYNYGYIGSITNNAGGIIQATGTRGNAIYNYGYFGSTGGIGNITNNADGIIQATGANGVAIYNDKGYIGSRTNVTKTAQAALTSGAIRLPSPSVPQGGIFNSGLIQATGAGGVAIFNNKGYIGTITNNVGGVIQATGASGVAISNFSTLGTIVNAGTILSAQGTAIVASGTIVNGITNAAGGLIQGGPADGSGTAIDATIKARAPLSIVNAGTIVGSILQSPFGDTLTVTGGAIIGNVIGGTTRGVALTGPTSLGVANFDLGTGSFTTGGNFIGVGTVNLVSGTLIMAPGGGAISGAQAFNIMPGGHAVLGNTLGAALTTNSGILDVGTNTGTLNGNYVQTANGTMQIGVTGTTAGMLKITGTATITPGPQSVFLHFTGPANLPASTIVFDAVGGLTLTSGTTLPVTSDSPNPYFQAPVVTDPEGLLTLTFGTPTQAALSTYANSLFPVSTSPYLNSAAAAFGARLSGVSESTYNTIVGQLAGLTASQLTAIAQQSAPRSVATAAAQLADGLGANTALSNAMAARQMTSHGPDSNPAGTGTTVWGQPFGSTAYQSTVQGFGGFTAGTYGAAFGGDRQITPDIRVGVAFAVANSNINYAAGASGNADSLTSAQFGVYGSYIRGNLFVDGDLSGGFNWVNSKQGIAFLGQQTGSYGGSQFAAHVGVGANVALPGAVLTYGASIRELHMDFGSYTMSGGQGPSASVNATSLDLVQSKMGGQITYLLEPVNGWVPRPEIHAYYLHNFNAAGLTTSGTFSNGLPFAVSAPSRDADLINAGFGLTMTKGAFSVSAAAQIVAGPSTTSDTFTLHVQSAF